MNDTELMVLQRIESLLCNLIDIATAGAAKPHPLSKANILDTQDVKLLFNMSDRSLHRHRKSGTLKASKIGGKYFYNEEDIRQLLRKTNGGR